MENLERYLVLSKLREIESELVSHGYAVSSGTVNKDYDLVAIKGSERIAVEVKAASDLKDSRDELRKLRERAARDGYQLRLVIVKPPHRISVEIENLEQTICEYMMDNIPSELDEISSRTSIEEVSDIGFDDLHIGREGIDVKGSGLVSVHLEYGGGEERDGLDLEDSYPLTFDLRLSHVLSIEEVRSLNVDTSSFYE